MAKGRSPVISAVETSMFPHVTAPKAETLSANVLASHEEPPYSAKSPPAPVKVRAEVKLFICTLLPNTAVEEAENAPPTSTFCMKVEEAVEISPASVESPSIARVEEAPSEPPTSRVEPKVEEAVERRPVAVVRPVSSTLKSVVEEWFVIVKSGWPEAVTASFQRESLL